MAYHLQYTIYTFHETWVIGYDECETIIFLKDKQGVLSSYILIQLIYDKLVEEPNKILICSTLCL
jgi:hypothetical protein